MVVCRKCGAPLRDTDKFCSQCGAKAPSLREKRKEALREEARKRRQRRQINFRTKSVKTRYTENFEEGENRSKALRFTVITLIIMLIGVSAVAYFLFPGRGADRKTDTEDAKAGALSEDRGTSIGAEQALAGMSSALSPALSSQTDASSDNSGNDNDSFDGIEQYSEKDDSRADNSGQTADGEQSALADDEQDEKAKKAEEDSELGEPSEVDTEFGELPVSVIQSKSEEETEIRKDLPDAAQVIDVSAIQTIIDQESTATVSEVYILDLKHDSEASLNDCTEPMYASALVTVPILYTAAVLLDEGELTMDTLIPYVSSIGGRGENTQEERDGLTFPLSFYLQTMTRYSDNNCINIMIDYLSLDEINSTCQRNGYTSVNMERALVAGDTGGLDNYVSARDLTMMVRDLYSGRFESINEEYMEEYFKIDTADSLPTLIALAPSLSDAQVLYQNGHGDTRYNETAIISDSGSEYILTIMLYGGNGLSYIPAVTDIAEYVNTAMTL